MLDVVETLQQLVRIPSVNPMGRDVSGPQYYEHALTGHLAKLFQQLNVSFEVHEVAPKRSNILARLDGRRSLDDGSPIVIFEAHQDTVPVDGMTIEPWSGELRDDRIYGRGSCDIKGGMAAMLSAFSQLAEDRPAGLPTLVMACSVNEEHGYSGALDMARRMAEGSSELVPRLPDAVVVAEPTLLDVVVAHKGVVRWRCYTNGRAAHSCRPELGSNAIYAMSRVVAALQRYAEEEVPRVGEHPLVGRPTMSVGLIEGGISVNTVPDRCMIEIDRRLLPDESPEDAYSQAVDYLSRALPDDALEHDTPYLAARGLGEQRNADLAARVGRASQAHGGAGQRTGVPYGTDAPAFASRDIPTVVFGPGSIDQAHTAQEWVEVDQLRKATRIYRELVCDWDTP